MYDEIAFQCPHCSHLLIEQSKAGDCSLRTFSQDGVPAEIAGDIISEKLWCNSCAVEWMIIEIPPQPQRVKLGLVAA